MPESNARGGSRLLRRAGIVGIAFTLRLIFASLSVRLPEVIRDTGLSASGSSLLTTLPVLCLGAFAPFAPWLAPTSCCQAWSSATLQTAPRW